MGERRRFTKEFKEDALNLAGRIGVKAASESLGVSTWSLYHWQKEKAESERNGIKAFPGHGNPRDEELARMKKENADLRLENEILKKAAAIFVKDRRG